MPAATDYTVLVDGYNVIHQHPAWRRLPLQAARRQLILWLNGARWPVPVGRILVIFDSPDGQPGAGAGAVRVQFAAPSADAELQAQIRASRTPGRLLVVSDDLEILRTAKSHGAVRHSCRWLLSRPQASEPNSAARRGREGAGRRDDRGPLPAASARRITEELAKRWLKPS